MQHPYTYHWMKMRSSWLQEKVTYLQDTHTTMKKFLQQNFTPLHGIDAIVKSKTSPLQMA